MKRLSFLFALSCFLVPGGDSGAVEFTVEKIWDRAEHSAFTDLIRHGDAFYCSFREGDGHTPVAKDGSGEGKVRVIRSGDGKTWESVALLSKKGYDLRDPKMSITSDGRIMLTIGGTKMPSWPDVIRHPQVSFSDKNGENFTDPVPAEIDESVRSESDWLWRVTWHKGIGYGVVYRIVERTIVDKETQKRTRRHSAGLVRTEDGIHYTSVKEFEFPLLDAPNEATVRFDDKDVMYILLRRENGLHGVFAESGPPYTEWNWRDVGTGLGGPNFIFMPSGKILFTSRGPGRTTRLYKMDENGKFQSILQFPSSGDTSYPGLVVHDGILWVSYYSGHEGKTSIYLAKIPVEQLEKTLN